MTKSIAGLRRATMIAAAGLCAALPLLAGSAVSAPGTGTGTGTGGTPNCAARKWTSGEIQQQIGSKNKDKKKLIMQVDFNCWNTGGNNFGWDITYMLRSQDKDIVGSGWHNGSAPTLAWSVAYKTGSTPHTQSGSNGGSTSPTTIANGTVVGAANVPVFTARSFHATRSGGSSGVTINWP